MQFYVEQELPDERTTRANTIAIAVVVIDTIYLSNLILIYSGITLWQSHSESPPDLFPLPPAEPYRPLFHHRVLGWGYGHRLRVAGPPHLPFHPSFYRFLEESLLPFFLLPGYGYHRRLVGNKGNCFKFRGNLMPWSVFEVCAPYCFAPIFLLDFSAQFSTFQLNAFGSHTHGIDTGHHMAIINSCKFTLTGVSLTKTLLSFPGRSDPTSNSQRIFLRDIRKTKYLIVIDLIVHPLKGAVVAYHPKRLLRGLSLLFGQLERQFDCFRILFH